MQKHIVLFGAGKSATVLIDFLKNLSTEKQWKVSIVDNNLANVQAKVGEHSFTIAKEANVYNEIERVELIKDADIVISLLPPDLHFLIAQTCLALNKSLLTASYVDDNLRGIASEIKNKGLLFLCEMGLDPGIDHMSAMQIFEKIRSEGGKVTSFKSHCGGLVAPESDDNPWHYKISWNSRNIIMAGKDGAVYKENNEVHKKDYKNLFKDCGQVNIPGYGDYAYYPNRDSLSYIPLYQLEDAHTFMRTTLRHPDFCAGWKNIVDLKFTTGDRMYDTDGMSISSFFKKHFNDQGFNKWLNELLTTRISYAKRMMDNLADLMENEQRADLSDTTGKGHFLSVDESGNLKTAVSDDEKEQLAARIVEQMHEANLSISQLIFLGLDDDTLINKGLCSPADILQFIVERKLALQPSDKDLIIMMHEVEYEKDGQKKEIKSHLVVKGDDSTYTGMAKTVGLPIGIAAQLILEGKIKETGLHIPTIETIYKPVLQKLEKYGIVFQEQVK